MADKKITQLTDLGTAIATDTLFNVVANPSTTPINNKVSTANIFNNIPTYLGLKQTADTLSASGAASVSTAITLVDATSGTRAISLAAGTDGQIKTIIDISSSNTNNIVITPSPLNGYSTITLNAAGETITLLFKNSKWNIIAGNGYTTA